MTTPVRRRLRQARRALWYTVAVSLVLMALVAGVASQLLPLAERHPERIAAWLSERAKRPVAFDALRTRWTRRGPLLRLSGLRVGEGAQAFAIGDAEILVAQYAGILPGRSFTELRLHGLDLTLERADDGRWSVRGLPGQQTPGGDPLGALEGLGELQVIAGRLAVVAPSLGIDATLPKIDLRLRVDGNRVRTGMRAWIRGDTAPLEARLDFDRRRGDGRAYAGSRRADLAAWSPLLRLAGVQAERGDGRAEAWADLRGHRVVAVTADAALRGVVLRGAPIPGAAGLPRHRFEHVAARARWRTSEEGWRFDAPLLRIGTDEQARSLDGLVVAGGRRYALLARDVDAGPLLAVAALSDRFQPGLRQWLHRARPAARLREVVVAGRRDGPLQARADIDSLGFAPVGTTPGIAGLSGRLRGDADGFAFDASPSATMRFDWPPGFGVPHDMTLQGTIAGWREGTGWRVGTDALRVRGRGFGAHVRGGLWFQGDGTRPWIDLAADLDEAPIPVAKGFWVRHLMPEASVRWLDAALVDGRVQRGRAVVSGDLDDWPFRDRNGLFRADAHIAGATLKFQPDWPAAEQVEGDVSFVADGFRIAGKGSIAGVGIQAFEAGIPRFGQAELSVRAQGSGDAARLLALLRRSPLDREHGETLANLRASGPAGIGFDMLLPMHRGGGAPRIDGTVDLRGVRLVERRWELDFDQVRGGAVYSRGGFEAERLSVRHDGQPGLLSLRAGDYVREKTQAFEAELGASIGADALLDKAPQLAWLKPYMEGRSDWSIGVAVPRAARGRVAPPSRLALRSQLVGTTLALPAPLRKAADTPLAARIDAALPLGSGEVEVALGQLLALRAMTRNDQTGVRVVLGGGAVAEAPPASGLVATGRAATLEAIDWIAIAKGDGKEGGGGGLPLRRLDVSADRLLVLGAAFDDARLQLAPVAGGTSVAVSGPALNGTLRVPDADGVPIAGRFQRMHWRGAGGGASAPSVATRAPVGADVDPAKIPPLALDIDDLRFNQANLGSARLRTRPTAGGLRLEQLQTRSSTQRIDVSGDWTGRGAAARTRLRATMASDDAGALLAGLGLGGQLAGGKGTATFDADWPGSPASLRLGALDGTLALDIKEGRLLELEPGAGRVLGLLSLAQLPRRLMLDFRDFFSKGFAFNRIDGHLRIAQGTARSDDLRIDGPAAQIRIRGAADLRAQTFDQTIEVEPKAGNLLTVAGAIAGGPVGAAIGAAANAVLNKPLRELAAKTYRVTGPWKEPKVEVIKREPARVGVADRPSPPG